MDFSLRCPLSCSPQEVSVQHLCVRQQAFLFFRRRPRCLPRHSHYAHSRPLRYHATTSNCCCLRLLRLCAGETIAGGYYATCGLPHRCRCCLPHHCLPHHRRFVHFHHHRD